MSQAPRNPFETAPDQLGRPAETSGSTWLWIFGIIGGVFLISALLCCGAGIYLWNQATGIIAEVTVEEFADDPIVMEKIGPITSSSMNMNEVIKESSKDDDIVAMVFDVSGEKGSGRIVERTDQSTGETTVVLIMDDGQEFELESIQEEEYDYDAELEGLEEMEPIDDSVEIGEELDAEPLPSSDTGSDQTIADE